MTERKTVTRGGLLVVLSGWFPCRCEPAWTGRDLHAPDCHADEIDDLADDILAYAALPESADEGLREAAQALVGAMEANRDAINGGGHSGPHDRVLHRDPCTDLPGVAHVYDLSGDCAQCGGAQYGTGDEVNRATGDLRELLGLERRPWEGPPLRAALAATLPEPGEGS